MLYFIGVIFFCSFYLVNLILAIVALSYREQVNLFFSSLMWVAYISIQKFANFKELKAIEEEQRKAVS